MAANGQEESVTEGVEKLQEIEAIRQGLTQEKARADANLAGWQRAQADLINYKRRTEQEKEETIKYANSELVLSILPVLDDFERALNSLPAMHCEARWLEGVRLIERKLRGILEARGLSQIKALGQPFDPRLHEAVRQDKGEEGLVVEEMEKGYEFHDRVIRPSRVVVGNGQEEDIKTAEGETPV